jgi:hypothetical protein
MFSERLDRGLSYGSSVQIAALQQARQLQHDSAVHRRPVDVRCQLDIAFEASVGGKLS